MCSIQNYLDKWKKDIYANWKFILYIILIGIILLPMICTIFYSIPVNDDFSMVNGCDRNTLLIDSIKRANEWFMTWSGLWPYMFIETLANPLLLFPLEGCWSGVEMFFLFLVFIVSLIVMIDTAMKKILGIYNKSLYRRRNNNDYNINPFGSAAAGNCIVDLLCLCRNTVYAEDS